MPPMDVFFSYHPDESSEVLALAEILRGRGLLPWVDVFNLVPGEPWQSGIEAAIAAAPAAAMLVGREGLGPAQERESCALLGEAARRGARVIPVLLPSAPDLPELPLFLRGFTWVDLRGGFAAEGIDRLVWGITGVRPATVAPPPAAEAAASFRDNLPWSSLGPRFMGRGAALVALEAGFAADAVGDPRAGRSKPQVICGLGGIGKTRLAVEYAWQAADRYSSIFFVGAATAESLRRGLAELAAPRRLDLRLADTSESARLEAVLGWLARHPGWLLIFDNVDTVEAQQALRQLLPIEGGHVLVTSRLSTWPCELRRHTLETLARRDAVAFLLATTGAEASDDAALADSLAELLGDLPLALEQAAAYIGARGIPFADYLRDWKEDRERILGWYDAGFTNYPLALAWTWSQSVARLGLLSRALLRLLAHYSTDPVPLAMLAARPAIVSESVVALLREGLGGGHGGIDVVGALAELSRFSLVTRQGGHVRVHRMVQEVERACIPEAQRAAWIERAVRLINDFAPRPPDDVRTWAVWDELRPHAERVIELAWSEGVGQPTAALMIELGILLSGKGLHGMAEPLLRRALLIDEACFGPRHPRIAVDLNNLAQILRAAGRLEEAEAYMLRALDIDESRFGADHPNVSRHLSNLAALLEASGRHAEAEPLMRRALLIDEQRYGPGHPKVSIRLNNLAMLLEATRRLDEAEPLARRALAISEKVFGPHHPRVASRLVNLARLLQGKENLDEAEPLVRRALAIDEHCYGLAHVSVARDRFALASLAGCRGSIEEAIGHCRRSLEICAASLGGGHPKTCSISHRLWELEERRPGGGQPAQGCRGNTSTSWRQEGALLLSENQATIS